MKPSTLLPCLALSALFPACSKDKTEPVDLGLEYFPKNVGHWVEYQVDSSWYNEGDAIYGSRSYRLRETIFEEFTDPEGRPAQRIRRSVQDSTGAWYTKDIWWQTRDNYYAERSEENLRRLKLSFPVKGNRYWNTNVYNTAEERELTYGELHVPALVDGTSFDSTITVESTYFNNIIDTLMLEERWAKHVGMVSRFQVESGSQYDTSLNTWLTTGWRVKMTAVAYGD